MDDLPLQFSYKVYRRPFRVPVRTSQGLWEARDGILVRMEDERGRTGYGEIAPIERFGTETVAGALAWCASLGARTTVGRVSAVPVGLPCTAWAMACAGAILEASEGEEVQAPRDDAATAKVKQLPVAALLPGGKAGLALLERFAGEGFRTFKLKIGAGDFANEVQHVARVVDLLPAGARLRLDANGGLDARTAIRWLDALQGWPIEFVEQPLPVDARRETIALAHDHGVPLAIDEAVRNADDVKRWRDEGWPGVFVIKPALAGEPREWSAEVAVDPGQFVFSSALETDIGTRCGIAQAFAAGVERALGYGVAAFFEDDGLGGGWGRPVVERVDSGVDAFERTWKRL
ncbi:o-succinylbenzoate synthase [Opitutales bacterium ASA1]|uniref:o-succinylbenzoate synthase n=1 Tax=Congregicoccus parvus TaxID=3081749 RepID=UPI002B2AD650|nr:o-succinylbenzoate synthase [Opitutales bacterium ASA1]